MVASFDSSVCETNLVVEANVDIKSECSVFKNTFKCDVENERFALCVHII